MSRVAEQPSGGESPDDQARSSRRRWAAFLGVAAVVIMLDQLAKLWVDASFDLARRSVPSGEAGGPTAVIGELVRIAKTYNDGGIFGLFDAAAPVLAVMSVLIIGGIGWYEWRHGSRLGPVVNTGLALLLGGALGNLIDRARFGHVIDFIDAGLGPTRWFAFNIADAAVSLGILLLFIGALLGDRFTPRASRDPEVAPGVSGDAATPPQGSA
jgi:signal peptidase II